jgi:exosortase family protein XrtG
MKLLLIVVLALAWLYLLRVLRRAELPFWTFLTGSMGIFLLLMVTVQPVLTQPLARAVAALAGVFGSLTGTFTAYFKYGIIFVPSAAGAMTLRIDFECSGIIEIMAFLSLLAFFRVYQPHEKLVIGLIGTAYIMLANALRIVLICLALHWFGTTVYYVMHTFVGRLLFYALSILLYFYVFTRPQVIRTRVGSFSYDRS